MAVIPLRGSRRDSLGKGGARKARAAGLIPGVVYGHGEPPVPVAVDNREFETALRHHKGGNAIVNLAVNGSEYTALIRDVQYDPLSHDILHLDFHHISLTETVEVRVNVHLNGLPIGVKDGGGILEHITREIEIRCLPTQIPSALEADVSALNIGDSIHVRDLVVPDVTILTDLDTTVATVVPPTVMEEKPVEEAAAAATAEPEVIAKGKQDEEGEAKDSKEKGDKGDKEKEKK
jgi:large subunit ribosomal protein L25